MPDSARTTPTDRTINNRKQEKKRRNEEKLIHGCSAVDQFRLSELRSGDAFIGSYARRVHLFGQDKAMIPAARRTSIGFPENAQISAEILDVSLSFESSILKANTGNPPMKAKLISFRENQIGAFLIIPCLLVALPSCFETKDEGQANLREESASLREESANLREESANLREELDHRETKISDLRSEMREKDFEISRLQEELRRSNEELLRMSKNPLREGSKRFGTGY